MHYMLRTKIPFIYLFVCAVSCVSVPSAGDYTIKGVVIRNSSDSDEIINAQIRVKKTREIFSCSRILQRTECSTEFRVRDYAGNTIEVSWKQGSRDYTTQILIEVPDGLKRDLPMTAILEISDGVSNNSYLTQ